MTAESPIGMENLAGHLKRHFDGSEERAQQAIQKYVTDNPDATSAQVFQSLSEGKGVGKSIVIDRDGALKSKGRKLSFKKSRKSRRKFS